MQTSLAVTGWLTERLVGYDIFIFMYKHTN